MKEISKHKPQEKSRKYERPFIVYSGKISTRAGSPASSPGDPGIDAVDPADLFGN